MRCFSYIIKTSLLFSSIFFMTIVLAQDNLVGAKFTVTPIGKDIVEVTAGDILEVDIRDDSTEVKPEFPFQDKIGDRLYILKKTSKSTFRVAVMEQPKKPEGPKLNYQIKYLGIYFNDKKNPKDNKFQVFDINYNIDKKDLAFYLKFVGGIISSLLLIVVFLVIIRKVKSIQDKKKLKQTFSEIVKNTKTRTELECLYQMRKKIIEVLGDKNFEKREQMIQEFFQVVNKYQFKETWSHEEEEEVFKYLNKVKGELGGI